MQFLNMLLTAGITLSAILAFLTSIFTGNPAPQKDTPSTSTRTEIPGMKTFSNELITFDYPPVWELESKNNPHGIASESIVTTYPTTDSGLPLFALYIYKSPEVAEGKMTFEQFDDPFTPSTHFTIDGRPAKRIHSVLTPKLIVATERIIISIPEKTAFIDLTYTHSGERTFDEEVEMYVSPMIESIKLN